MLLVPCAQKVQYASVNHKGVLMNRLQSEASSIINLALALLMAAPLLYLKEIQLATKTLREGSEFLEV